jgi:hypothetical protein
VGSFDGRLVGSLHAPSRFAIRALVPNVSYHDRRGHPKARSAAISSTSYWSVSDRQIGTGGAGQSAGRRGITRRRCHLLIAICVFCFGAAVLRWFPITLFFFSRGTVKIVKLFTCRPASPSRNGSTMENPMPNSLQYPLDRHRDLQRRWQRLLQKTAKPSTTTNCGELTGSPLFSSASLHTAERAGFKGLIQCRDRPEPWRDPGA